MKKSRLLSVGGAIIISLLLGVVGCGGGGGGGSGSGGSGSNFEPNVWIIGDWNYTVRNTFCPGVESYGVINFGPFGFDVSRVGSIDINGDDFDRTNCILFSTNSSNPFVNAPAILDSDVFLTELAWYIGLGEGANISQISTDLTKFTSNEIIIRKSINDGSITTISLIFSP